MPRSGDGQSSAARRAAVAVCLAALGWVLPAAVAPAAAEVRVEVQADGSKVVYNVPAAGATAPRRAATRPAAARARYQPLIDRHSLDHGLDPRLVRAVVEAESSYDRRAVSHKGAQGLMQLMPSTAAVFAVDDPYDPDQNLRGGTAYLAEMIDRFGRLDLALAAYNAGPTAVERYGGVPPYRETRAYVERVLSLYEGRPVSLPPAAAAPPAGRRGAKPRLERDGDKLVLTNTPPG